MQDEQVDLFSRVGKRRIACDSKTKRRKAATEREALFLAWYERRSVQTRMALYDESMSQSACGQSPIPAPSYEYMRRSMPRATT